MPKTEAIYSSSLLPKRPSNFDFFTLQPKKLECINENNNIIYVRAFPKETTKTLNKSSRMSINNFIFSRTS